LVRVRAGGTRQVRLRIARLGTELPARGGRPYLLHSVVAIADAVKCIVVDP